MASKYNPADRALGEAVLGPDARYIKLITVDNHEFIIDKQLACDISPKIRDMMGPGCCEVLENHECLLTTQDFESHIVQKFCSFLYYMKKYRGSVGPIPNFPIKHDEAIEMMLIGHFFEV